MWLVTLNTTFSLNGKGKEKIKQRKKENKQYILIILQRENRKKGKMESKRMKPHAKERKSNEKV